MPVFVGAPSISQKGNLTIMVFTVESASEPKVTWFKDEVQINSSGRFAMKTKKGANNQYTITCEVTVSIGIWLYMTLT